MSSSGHLHRPMMIRLPEELRQRIEAQAAFERRTPSAMVRIMLEDALASMPPRQPPKPVPIRAGAKKR